MSRKPIVLVSALALVAVLAVSAFAVTWSPIKATCPLCGAEDEFYVVASRGSYVYHWPSKYQYIFSPITDERAIYACRKCSFVSFWWDFKSVPEEKKDALKKALREVKLPPPIEKKDKGPTYDTIPMDARLAVAEQVYTVLGLDDEDWCFFYRVAGYHYDALKMAEKAKTCREKALSHAEKLTAQKENAGRLRELHLITGAMRHFLGRDKEAVADFKKALSSTPFEDEKLTEKQNASKDKYLTELLKEYIQKIENPKAPRP